MSTVTWRRVMIVLAVVAVVIAGVVVVARVFLHRNAGSAPAASPAPHAPLPQGFPDLSGFADVSQDHDVSHHYPLATFTSPTGLQCALWSSRGDTAAFCFGAIPGLDRPANQVYAGDYKTHFDQSGPPAADKLNGKPLASGQKVVLGAGGTLMGGDQITCGVHDVVVACELIRGFHQNHGDQTAPRHGFVLDPQRSWTF